MQNIGERKTLLVQDIRDLTSELFPKIVEIYNDLSQQHSFAFNHIEAYHLVLCELMTRIYCYTITNYVSVKDTNFKYLYYTLANKYNKDRITLEVLFSFYVKGPAIHNNEAMLSLTSDGSDIVLTYLWNGNETHPLKTLKLH